MKFSSNYRLPLLLLPFTAIPTAIAAAPRISLVASTGDPAAGFGSGATFAYATEPNVTPEGKAVFAADIQGTNIAAANNTGIFLGTKTSNLQLVAREGSPAPGLGSGVLFNNLLLPSVGAAGNKACFSASLKGNVTAANNGGVFFGAPGSLQVVAREGSAAPGTGLNYGDNWSEESTSGTYILSNKSGSVAFAAKLVGGGVTLDNDVALFAGPPAALVVAAREGDAAPGCGGAVYSEGGGSIFLQTVFGGSGRLFFRTLLTGTGVNFQNNVALFTGQAGGITLFARMGDPAPGTAAGTLYGDLVVRGINDAGDLLFTSDLTGPGGASILNRRALYLSSGGGAPTLIAREGETGPGGQAPYFAFDDVVINHQGDVAFRATLSAAGNPVGIWTITSGIARLIAQTGGRPAGLPTGIKYLSIGLHDLQFNILGQVAFTSNVGTSFADQQRALFATDAAGTLHLVAKVGGKLSVRGTDRTIHGFNVLNNESTGSGGEDGRSLALGENGQLTIGVQFDLGAYASVLLADLNAVADPQPDALVSGKASSGFLGNDTYNSTATGQKLNATIKRGSKTSFYVKVQNDGDTDDRFTLKGTATDKHFSVAYYDSAKKNITTAVVAGTYKTSTLVAGAEKTYRLELKVNAKTSAGSAKDFKFTAKSGVDPSFLDVVKAGITAK